MPPYLPANAFILATLFALFLLLARHPFLALAVVLLAVAYSLYLHYRPAFDRWRFARLARRHMGRR